MRDLDVALLEWPDGRERGGPRLIGRTSDPDLVQVVREYIASQRRSELARLEVDPEGPSLRAVPRPEPEGGAG